MSAPAPSARRVGPPYRPGKPPAPGGIKLSSNELPFEPLPAVLEAIAGAATGTGRYPDPRGTALREALAAHHGVDVSQVTIGSGSVTLLQQLCQTYAGPGDGVAFGWPSFEAYPMLTALCGATAVTAPTEHEALDLDALGDAIEASAEPVRLVLVADPNNPTGTSVTADAFDRLVARVPADCLVVLDRAYAEFMTAADAVDEAAVLAHPNVAVLRTFSKAHALAGLRVGWMVAHPDVVAAVDGLCLPFAVSSAAQAAALASLGVLEAVESRCAAVVATRRRLEATLRRHGFRVPDPQGNFVWLPGLQLDLDDAGVSLRRYEAGTRITIGREDEVDRLLGAIAGLPTGTLDLDPDHGSWAQAWIDRLDAVEDRLGLLATPRDGLTEPDPGKDERWDHGQVWAHLGEIGGYWLAEVATIRSGSATFGRVKTNPARIAAIEAGRHDDPDLHLRSARAAMAACRRLVAATTPEERALTATHSTLGAMDLDAILQHFLVGHYEEHAAQLEELA